jgi:hypothetical protein
MQNKASVPPAKHILGLDLAKLVLIGPIAMLHVWDIFYADAEVTLSRSESLYPYYRDTIGRVFGFAGTFIFVLSFFLFGYRGKTNLVFGKKQLLRLGILCAAMLSAQFSATGDFIWDVFSFVLVSLALISVLGRLSSKAWDVVGLVAAVLLCIPPASYSEFLSSRLLALPAEILIATTSRYGQNGWFLLPWIGLPLLGYSFGRFCARTAESDESAHRLQAAFAPILFLAVYCLVFILGRGVPTAAVRGTAEYYDFAFRQSPLVFWRHFVPFLFFLFFATRPAVNAWLNQPQLWLARILPKLQWSRNFWLAYVTHFGIIEWLVEYEDFFAAHLGVFDFLWLYVIIGTEVLLQAFFFMLKVYAGLFTRVYAMFKRLKRKPALVPSDRDAA